jgi:hypothetical protein
MMRFLLPGSVCAGTRGRDLAQRPNLKTKNATIAWYALARTAEPGWEGWGVRLTKRRITSLKKGWKGRRCRK